ncbi:phage holin family protein [Agriterribacter sp.]|uniref:phage holin family protein n=1 Tax=Agriterribacter sp. TaxID=2821509 RepID=UPI002C6EFE90|nr:phage holin family protein [Agriterribacter sp.]HTN08760.1 phage holin family protein [Agriterribacter sp.]
MKETISENITTLVDDAGRYIEAKTELWKLKAVDKTTEIATALILKLLFILIGFIAVIALNTGIALLIGKWLGEAYYGFFIVAGFYLLLGLVVYAARDSLIKKPFYKTVINKILK